MTSLLEPTAKLAPQPAGMKHRFHAMAKPVGSLCNLNCTYCYYLPPTGHSIPRNQNQNEKPN